MTELSSYILQIYNHSPSLCGCAKDKATQLKAENKATLRTQYIESWTICVPRL